MQPVLQEPEEPDSRCDVLVGLRGVICQNAYILGWYKTPDEEAWLRTLRELVVEAGAQLENPKASICAAACGPDGC